MSFRTFRASVSNDGAGRARAIWRILVPAVAIILFNSVIGGPASEYIGSLPILHLVTTAGTAVVALVIVQLSGRFLDAGRTVVDYGLAVDRRWLRDLGVGFAIGFVGVSVPFLVGIAAGWFKVATVFHQGSHTVAIGLAIVVLANLCTGIWEELLARGVILTNAAEGLHPWLSSRQAIAGGVAISALLFGLPHFGQPGIAGNPILLVTWILAGAVFGVLYVLSSNMALVIGIHWAFNTVYQTVFVRTDVNPEKFSAIARLDPATRSPFFEFGGVLEVSAFISVLILGILWLRYSEETLSVSLPLNQVEGKAPSSTDARNH